jgi:DNA topoisomerase-3
METAGKLCDDEELRDAMKENGLGRPSTRAAIIETLFKRRYIRREKKNLVATQTGIDVIGTIHDELLKSAELTGQWESKLRKIERGEYEAVTFLTELKEMVNLITYNVKTDRVSQRVTLTTEEETKPSKGKSKKASGDKTSTKSTPNAEGEATKKKRAPRKKAEPTAQPAPKYTQATLPQVCPLCGRGRILRGRTAYGCSEYASGCTFRIPLSDVAEG